MASESLVQTDRYGACLEELGQTLNKFGLSGEIKLLLVHDSLQVNEGEVVVQVAGESQRVASLVVKGVADLDRNDVLLEAGMVDPADEDYVEYVNTIRAASCLVRNGLHGQKVHIYD